MATLNTNLCSGQPQPLSLRFPIGELLGSGAYAQVFASSYPGTGSPVVLKIANIGEEIFSLALKSEQTMLMQAQHPHVVRFREGYSICSDNDLRLVLDRIAPDISKTYLRHNLSLTANETITIGKQLLEALAAFHAKGFIHRDLKPNNLSYDPKSRQLKLFDFGSAARRENIKPGREIQCTWYRAPEVFLGALYDDRIDIWSVGCILFELYTGEALFSLLMCEKDPAICLSRINAVFSPNELYNWQHRIRLAAAAEGLTQREANQEAEQLIHLIAPMIERNPENRIRAKDALELPGFQSDIRFTIETTHFGPLHFDLYDVANEENPILSLDLSRPKNVQNACLHVPANLTHRYIAKIKNDDNQVVKSFAVTLENGQTIQLDRCLSTS